MSLRRGRERRFIAPILRPISITVAVAIISTFVRFIVAVAPFTTIAVALHEGDLFSRRRDR